MQFITMETIDWIPEQSLNLADIEALTRREKIQDRFTLPKAKALAAVRLARLNQCLEWLQEESINWI